MKKELTLEAKQRMKDEINKKIEQREEILSKLSEEDHEALKIGLQEMWIRKHSN